MTAASRRAMKSFRASDGLALRYLVDDYTHPWQAKQVLFLLHAAMGSSSRLYRWIPILARNFIVVRPDMRGHGQSEVPGPHQFSFQRLARDVARIAGGRRANTCRSASSLFIAVRSTTSPMSFPNVVRRSWTGFCKPSEEADDRRRQNRFYRLHLPFTVLTHTL